MRMTTTVTRASVLLLLVACCQGQLVTVTVDSSADGSQCISAQELIANRSLTQLSICPTINAALNYTLCNDTCPVVPGVSISNVLIRLEDGSHALDRCIAVMYSSDVVFEAINPGRAIVNCASFPNNIPDSWDDILVCESNNIEFRGIRFEMCGPRASNVYVTYTTDITFDGCTFHNNTGTPLQFRFCTGVRVVNTEFSFNDNSLVAVPDTENTTLESLMVGEIHSGALTFYSASQDNLEMLVHNCTFISNSGNENDPNNSRPVLLKNNGHGGAMLIRLSSCSNGVFNISDTMFIGNQAQVDGGAMYIFLSDSVSSNTFTLRNNTFINNVAEQASGGAVSISSFNLTFDNSILVEDCRFFDNTGSAGGGFSVALYDSNLDTTRNQDEVNFTRCEFIGNSAVNEGTAVGLFSLVHVDQIGFPVSFTDCTFTNNTSLEDNQDTSAIASFRFPIIFSGSNIFTGNIGGGITLLNTRMEASGRLWFIRNIAGFGAGIAMDDRCLLEIKPNTDMFFLENEARESGAGIYVEFPPIRFVVNIFNRLCFLQYKDPDGNDVEPQNWDNVTIQFTRNVARLSGASIFASDMQQCSWLGNNFTDNSSLIFIKPLDLGTDYFPFSYSENDLLPEGMNVSQLSDVDLATAPSMITATIPTYNYVQPGEILQINLLATDQVGNSREAVWSLEAPSSQANLDALSAITNTHPYHIPSVDNLPGINVTSLDGRFLYSEVGDDFSSEFNITFSLLRTLGTPTNRSLKVNRCHPGYKLDPMTGVCMCDTDQQNILRCDDNKRYLYLREGIWASSTDNRTLITARVQPGYVNCTRQGRLQGCRFMFDDPSSQCRDDRTGQLCGQCKENFSVTFDLLSCRRDDTCYIGVIVFVTYCILIIIVFLVVLIFDVTLANELKAFFFYAQVIGLVYRPYQVVQDSDNQSATDDLSIFLNILGFSVPFPLCLWPGVPAHYVALLGYVPPGLALLTIIGYVIAAQFFSALGKHSALKALTFLSLIIYKYVADTAFVFISCLPTDDVGFVFQFDGSQNCLAPQFIVFFLIGLILVVFFVAPTPFFLMYISQKRPLRFQHYADVLTNGLKAQHRWWGGWDLGRRLPFIIIAVLVVLVRPSVILFLMSVTALVVLLIHVFTKPFAKMYINVIEAAILLNLLMVTAAFLDPSNSPVPFEFSTILVLIPYFYALGYILYRIGYIIWTHVKKIKAKAVPPKEEAVPANALRALGPDAGQSEPSTNESTLVDTKATPGSSGATASPSDQQQPGQPKKAPLTMSDSNFLREPLLEDNF